MVLDEGVPVPGWRTLYDEDAELDGVTVFEAPSPPHLITAKERVYWILITKDHAGVGDVQGIWSLDYDQSIKELCRIQFRVPVKDFLDDPPIANLVRKFEPIRGQAVWCGTNTNEVWKYAGETYMRAISEILFQPWIVTKKIGEDVDAQLSAIRSHISYWGLSDPVSWVRSQEALVNDDYFVAFYKSAYGLDDNVAERMSKYAVTYFAQAAIDDMNGRYGDWLSSIPRIGAYSSNFDEFVSRTRMSIERYIRTSPVDFVEDEVGHLLSVGIVGNLDVSLLIDLVERGTDVGWYELALAVVRPEVLARLLENGAAPDLRNVYGKTALMYAAHLNTIEAMAILLDKGASVDAETKPMDPEDYTGCQYDIRKWGRTALMYAAANADVDAIQLLLDYGANKAAQDTEGNIARDYLGENERLRGTEDWFLAWRLLTLTP